MKLTDEEKLLQRMTAIEEKVLDRYLKISNFNLLDTMYSYERKEYKELYEKLHGEQLKD